MTKQNTLFWLIILLALFLFRVLSQLVQYFEDVLWLPSFHDWHSATIPYVLLLLSQLVIIVVIVVVILNIYRDRYRFERHRACLLLWAGGIYFSFMLLRLILSLTIMPNHPWFGATLPALFHLVLAGIVLVTGLYERYGYQQDHGK